MARFELDEDQRGRLRRAAEGIEIERIVQAILPACAQLVRENGVLGDEYVVQSLQLPYRRDQTMVRKDIRDGFRKGSLDRWMSADTVGDLLRTAYPDAQGARIHLGRTLDPLTATSYVAFRDRQAAARALKERTREPTRIVTYDFS